MSPWLLALNFVLGAIAGLSLSDARSARRDAEYWKGRVNLWRDLANSSLEREMKLLKRWQEAVGLPIERSDISVKELN